MNRADGGVKLVRGRREAADLPLCPACPSSVDISLTGRCQLRCAWCWGPRHDLVEDATWEQWRVVLSRLAEDGASHIVFTGGEPLVSSLLREGLRFAKRVGLKTTLSTNGILLRKRLDVIDYVDDLGIPIDGPTPEVNNLMREGSARNEGWEKAVDAILVGQSAGVPVTVRSVISRINIQHVSDIPAALEARNVDLKRLRFKLYQIEPIGPHASTCDFTNWAITDENASCVAAGVKIKYPQLDVTLQLYRLTRGRYFQIDPRGNSYGTDLDADDLPLMIGYGNIFADYRACLNAYLGHQQSIAEER